MITRHNQTFIRSVKSRRGAIAVLTAVLLVVLFAMVAFGVDIGFIASTKTQMQNAADASAHAAVQELPRAMGMSPQIAWSEVDQIARQEASNVASLNPNGNLTTTQVDPISDVRLGRLEWDIDTNQWKRNWGTAPFNIVEVNVIRNSERNNLLPLFFAPVLGSQSASLQVRAVAGLMPAHTFGGRSDRSSGTPGRNVMILPFTVDINTWTHLIASGQNDSYAFNWTNKKVLAGPDGAPELNIYPIADKSIPAGNFGTINLGVARNNTPGLIRQILAGLTEQDLEVYGGELSTVPNGLDVTGNPGISAGMEDALISIVGQTRILPLFSEVSGNGSNCRYKIVKLVGCRIMACTLSGSLRKKYVYVQPATFIDNTAKPLPHNTYYPWELDSILSPPRIID